MTTWDWQRWWWYLYTDTSSQQSTTHKWMHKRCYVNFEYSFQNVRNSSNSHGGFTHRAATPSKPYPSPSSGQQTSKVVIYQEEAKLVYGPCRSDRVGGASPQCHRCALSWGALTQSSDLSAENQTRRACFINRTGALKWVPKQRSCKTAWKTNATGNKSSNGARYFCEERVKLLH